MMWAVLSLALIIGAGAIVGVFCALGKCKAESSSKSETSSIADSVSSPKPESVSNPPSEPVPPPTADPPTAEPVSPPTAEPVPPPTAEPVSPPTAEPMTCEVVASYFDSDAEGWSLFRGGERLSHNLDGYIEASNTYGPHSIWYYAAPPKFHGNHAGSSGLSFSLRLLSTLVPVQDRDAIIRSSSGPFIWFSAAMNPGGSFTPYILPFFGTDKAGWQSGRTQTNATHEEIMAVLTDIGSLEIRGSFDSYQGITSQLDNVVLECPDP